MILFPCQGGHVQWQEQQRRVLNLRRWDVLQLCGELDLLAVHVLHLRASGRRRGVFVLRGVSEVSATGQEQHGRCLSGAVDEPQHDGSLCYARRRKPLDDARADESPTRLGHPRVPGGACRANELADAGADAATRTEMCGRRGPMCGQDTGVDVDRSQPAELCRRAAGFVACDAGLPRRARE